MTTTITKTLNSMTRYLPEVLPADPRAPETTKYRSQPLTYGLIGKFLMALNTRRAEPTLEELSDHIRKDIGANDADAFHGIATKSWNLPARWRRPRMPERLGYDAMQLFSSPRAF